MGKRRIWGVDMGKGLLHIQVFADNYAQPLRDAEVTVLIGQTSVSVLTDGDGRAEPLQLNCPDRALTMSRQTQQRPYEVCEVRVERSGLRTTYIEGVQIFDGSVALQNVILQSAPSEGAPPETVRIPDHLLWGRYPNRVPESRIPGYVNASQRPNIPRLVGVHDALPACRHAPCYRVSFLEYVKNIAAGLIYPTWPREAVQALVTGLVTATLCRIDAQTAAGADYMLTSAPQHDFVFMPGRNHFGNIAEVVDEVFWLYLRKETSLAPLFVYLPTQNQPVTTPHVLPVWDVLALAQTGLNVLAILKRLLGEEIALEEVGAVEWLERPRPAYSLRMGMCNEHIRLLQMELSLLATCFPSLLPLEINGCYDEKTVQAVKAFQGLFERKPTGAVEPGDWYRIAELYQDCVDALAGAE